MIARAKLTAKQERFAQLVSSDKTQADAYRLAYDAQGSSDQTIQHEATLLAQNPTVAPRIAELQARYADVAELNAAYVLSSLMTNVERAMQASPVLDRNGKPTGTWEYEGSVANKALELLGKHLGMFVNRVEHAGVVGLDWHLLDGMSLTDLQALVDAGKALRDARVKAIEGEGRVLETSEDADSGQ
jgi:phage terminase small subunit